MKNTIKSFALLFFALGFFACAHQTNTNSNQNSATAIDKQTYQAVGIIKAVDAGTGKVTIDHEDIPGYMSAMEMNEIVSDRKLLNSIKPGDKVKFEIDRTGAKIIITKIDKIN